MYDTSKIPFQTNFGRYYGFLNPDTDGVKIRVFDDNFEVDLKKHDIVVEDVVYRSFLPFTFFDHTSAMIPSTTRLRSNWLERSKGL